MQILLDNKHLYMNVLRLLLLLVVIIIGKKYCLGQETWPSQLTKKALISVVCVILWASWTNKLDSLTYWIVASLVEHTRAWQLKTCGCYSQVFKLATFMLVCVHVAKSVFLMISTGDASILKLETALRKTHPDTFIYPMTFTCLLCYMHACTHTYKHIPCL